MVAVKKAGGKAKSAAGASPAPKEALREAATAEAQPPPKLNLYDGGAVKNALDDAAKEILIEAGHVEDLRISNIKIGVGLVAICLALYAQFGPGKFPGTWWTVFACVVLYGILAGFLNLLSWWAEGDAFMLTKPAKGSQKKGLRLSSKLERFDHHYTLIISEGSTWSITEFFHEDGYLCEPAFKKEVLRLLGSKEE